MQIKYPCRVRIIGNHNSHQFKVGETIILIRPANRPSNCPGKGHIAVFKPYRFGGTSQIIRDIDFILINNKEVFYGNKN